MSVHGLGWDPALERAYRDLGRPDWVPARVVRIERGVAHVRTGPADDDERAARLGGRLVYRAGESAELPVVGDWVVLAEGDGGDLEPLVRARLPRRSSFARQAAGRTRERQVLAANLDVLFVVCGLDGDFNLRRIERYVALALAGDVQPVVVLNKVDVCDDVPARVAETRAVAPDAPVVAIGAKDGRGLEALGAWLAPATTVALVGSSGAGKSTLLNRLLGEDRVRTAEVRESDDRGRHTTTRRELFVLPGGALCIDTPGLRELKLDLAEDQVDSAFPDVEAIAADCRFRDCVHDGEPGCAVSGAIERGALEADRVDAWRRLRREVASQERRADPREARATARRQGRLYKRIQKQKKNRR